MVMATGMEGGIYYVPVLAWFCRESFPYEQEFVDFLDIERGMSPRSIEAYCIDMRVFAGFLKTLPGGDVSGVGGRELRDFLVYLKKERDNGPKTRNRKLATLRCYFSFLEMQGYMDDSPARKLRDVKTGRTLPVFLSQEEGQALLECAGTVSRYPERDYAIIQLFLQTGCRLNELVGLEMNQVNLDERYVRFRGKGDKERIVPLTESTCRAVEEYLRVRSPKRDCNRVFISSWGVPVSRRGVQDIFERLCKKAGMGREKLSVHKLRHTCLTLLLKAGVDLVTLREIAGHENISTTGVYVHITQSDVREAMERHPLN